MGTNASKDDNNILSEPQAAFQVKVAGPGKSFATGNFNPVRRAVALMGLGKDAGAKAIHSKTDFISYMREGIPKIAIDNLTEVTGFSALEMAALLHTTDRTLRRYEPAQKLNPEQSERLIELALLYARGEEVFDTLEPFKIWMDAPVMALGDKKPRSFLDTSMGIELLMDELGRIEHGIFA